MGVDVVAQSDERFVYGVSVFEWEDSSLEEAWLYLYSVLFFSFSDGVDGL